jgi:putative addiction module component (TIGR02574 family)
VEQNLTPSLQELGIDRLSGLERLELIAAIWDSIPDTQEALPVPEWHRQELERRLAAAEATPGAGTPWEEVRARLRRKR